MRRVVRPEILDTQTASEPEVRRSLTDLQRINRWFGGTRTAAGMIDRVFRRTGLRALSVLDVGSASGDVVAEIAATLAPKRQLNYTLLDRVAAHFNGTRAQRVQGDALALPFRDNSFDVALCSLFAHHLEPDEFTRFAREALRVSRIALLINDLRRSSIHLAMVVAGAPLFGPITRHDSVASVLRSYTSDEMRSMLFKSGAASINVHHHYLYRMGAMAWK